MKGLYEVGFRGLPIKTRNNKRTLKESGIVIDVEKEVVEISPEEFNFRGTKKVKVKVKDKSKGKGKQAMIQDVIDVDNDDSLTDTNKVKLGGNYKGKDLIYLSDDDASDEEKTRLFKKQELSCMTAGRTGTEKQTASKKLSGGTKIPAANTVHEDAIKRIKQFENFAIVGDFSDHHFANNLVSTQPQKAWTKKIQDEWKILQSSLPETIFVRACESKMSLLRVAIIGPQGTPYHDGLFFFDVMFPSTYPQAPPQVYYHSGGLRLNPNLYNCGYVCLSLLGTWHGQSAAENWIPGKSTMLQVLVSIQALILNAKPYFNEPGYDSYEGSFNGEKASQKYNEETLIKSLKTMLYSLRKPPKHFEGLVSDHFISRSRDILLACNAYMDGAQVGSVSIVEGKAIKDHKKTKCSPSLKDNVGVLMNNLIDEFAKLGVKNCEEFRHPESNSKNEESMLVSSGKSQFLTNLKSVVQKKSKAKSKKGSANKLAPPTPPSVSAAYPFPPPSVAWNPSSAAWIAPSASYHASSAAMLSLPHPAMPNVLQKISDADAR